MDFDKYNIFLEEILKNNKKDGKGILINDNKNELEINFKNNIIERNRILNYNDGRIINGIFDINYISIEGKLIFKGEIYESKLNKNGKREGKLRKKDK